MNYNKLLQHNADARDMDTVLRILLAVGYTTVAHSIVILDLLLFLFPFLSGSSASLLLLFLPLLSTLLLLVRDHSPSFGQCVHDGRPRSQAIRDDDNNDEAVPLQLGRTLGAARAAA